MKKLLIGALIAMSAVSFVACGDSHPVVEDTKPHTVTEQVPMDDEVTTMDDTVFCADLTARTDAGSSYCYEIQDICDQLANNPYSAPAYADICYEYVEKFRELEYTKDEMAMMSDEQLEIAIIWNTVMQYMEEGCGLFSQGCAEMDAELIDQANYYFELAIDTLNE